METIKKIGYLLIALVYLFLSTGVALVKTNCVCSDLSAISVYDISDSQDEILLEHNCCEENLPVSDHLRSVDLTECGCDIPTITYLKLTNHPGSESKIEYPAVNTLCLAYYPGKVIFSLENTSVEEESYPHYSPPEKPYGRNLINLNNQRKIALTA